MYGNHSRRQTNPKQPRPSDKQIETAKFVGFVSHKKTLTTVSIPTVQEVLSKFIWKFGNGTDILGHPEGDRHATENTLIYSLIRTHKYPGRDTFLYMNLVNTTNQLVAKTFIDIISVADPDPFFNKQGQTVQRIEVIDKKDKQKKILIVRQTNLHTATIK